MMEEIERNFHHLKLQRNVKMDKNCSGIGTSILTASRGKATRASNRIPTQDRQQEGPRYPKRDPGQPVRYRMDMATSARSNCET